MKLWRYIFGIFLLTLFTLFALANDDMVMINLPNILDGKSLKKYISSNLFADFFSNICRSDNWSIIEYLRNFKLRKAFNENNKKLLKIEKELQKNKEKFLTEEEKIINLLD